MESILFFFKRYWIKFVVSVLIGFFLMAIYNTSAGRWDQVSSYSNGAFVGGAVLFLIGMLSIVNGFGAFDLASFYFMRKQFDETRKENYGEYVSRRKDERSASRTGFLPYVIVGAIFIIVGISMFYSIRVS